MLQNAYLLAKIGADTAENERNVAENLPRIGTCPTGPGPCLSRPAAADPCPPGAVNVRRNAEVTSESESTVVWFSKRKKT